MSFAEVKQAAHGQWKDILIGLGVEEELLSKKNKPCPFCGGKDRFSFTDKTQAGEYFCRGCKPGDGFNFVANYFRIDNKQAIRMVAKKLGIQSEYEANSNGVQETRIKKDSIKSTFEESATISPGSAVYQYLVNRGLKPCEWEDILSHPALDYFEERKLIGKWPAMVSLITRLDGTPDGIHRTYLTKDGQKAPVQKGRERKISKINPNLSGGVTIKLDYDTSGGVLAVAEGLETSMYVREATGLPTWSAINANLMRQVQVPEDLDRLYIFADNDKNQTGQKAAWELAERYLGQIAVYLLVAPEPGKDWLDCRGLTMEIVEATPLYSPLERWPDPKNFELPPVMPFDYAYLPDFAQDHLARQQATLQCPLDYLAASFFISVGMLVGTRCAVRPKVLDEWYVIPNFFGALVGAASTMKTPAMTSALAPINKFEHASRKEHRNNLKKYAQELGSYKLQLDGLHQLRRKDPENKKTIERIEELEKNEPVKPTLARYSVNQVSTPKLIEMLGQNPRGLLSWHDELTGILSLWDDPRNATDKAFVLKCWSGLSGHADDTITRGDGFAELVCLSFFGGIQIDKLQRYILRTIKNGSDGLLARLQIMVFPDEPDWQYSDLGEDKDAKKRFYDVLEYIDTCDFVELGAIENDKRPYFSFSYDAQGAFEKWFKTLRTQKIPKERAGLIKEHLSKYNSLMPALAMLIHICTLADACIQDRDNGDTRKLFRPGPITLEATEKAIEFCEYLESHARRVYSLSGGEKQSATTFLADKIAEGEMEDNFTSRTIARKGWSELHEPELIEAALDRLVGANWLEATDSQGKGRMTTEYRVNPKVLKEKIV
jgi:putative DNA primase/helicase